MSQDNQNQPGASYIMGSLSSVSIEHMELSRRTKNALLRAGLKTALDIQKVIETQGLTSIRNIGTLAINEIEECMSSLLENVGINLPADEINLFVNDESKIATIPTAFYDDLPIDILAEELGNDLINRLKSADFKKMGELFGLSQTVAIFIQNASKSLDRLINYQKAILQKKMATGELHPQAQYHNLSIKSWLNITPVNPKEQLEVLNLLTQVNELNSLTDELSLLFSEISEREMEIYVKYFNENLTLEQIGRQQGITRERVRQITSKTASRLWRQINSKPGLYFQSALLQAQNIGEQLSLQSWKQLLKSKRIIEPYLIRKTLGSFDAFCIILRSSDKSEYPPKLKIAESIKIILNSPTDLPLGLIKAIEEISSKAKREIQRKISYMGGIHLIEASDILDVVPQQSTYILKHLGYKEIIHDWYTITSGDVTSRWPILKAGLAMMEVCGPLEFNLFCDGIRRYISRFYDVLAPPKVMKAHLRALGFELEDEYVCWHETPSGYLAESDECFILVTEKYGPVVTFQEVVEIINEKGFSFATATARVLPQSPIVEKVDIGLYKIRGQDHTWEDIENAKNRQETIDYDPEVTYGIDGIIRYRITIGSWALNGVLSISSSQQPLPDLRDGWEVLIGGKPCGTARGDEQLIWGLGGAINALGVKIGDRIELAFDAWEKPVIRITKI